MTFERVSFTGHRALSDAQVAWLRPELDRVLTKLVDEHGCTDAAYGAGPGRGRYSAPPASSPSST